jgi:hypothetical protein
VPRVKLTGKFYRSRTKRITTTLIAVMTAKARAAGDDKSNPFTQSDASICDNQLIAWAMRSIPCVMNESLESDETDVDSTIVPSSLQCSQDSISVSAWRRVAASMRVTSVVRERGSKKSRGLFNCGRPFRLVAFPEISPVR